MISDAGYQGEITSISTAAQQIEVFSRILKTTLANYVKSVGDTQQRLLKEFTVSCHFTDKQTDKDNFSISSAFQFLGSQTSLSPWQKTLIPL